MKRCLSTVILFGIGKFVVNENSSAAFTGMLSIIQLPIIVGLFVHVMSFLLQQSRTADVVIGHVPECSLLKATISHNSVVMLPLCENVRRRF